MADTTLTGTLYVPNAGEMEMLKDVLVSQALVLGLYKASVTQDGSLTMASLTELPTGGGRGYAQIALDNVVVEDAKAAGKWYMSQNSAGKAQGQYGLDAGPVTWTFAAQEVTDANTIYGVFGYTWVVPFASGTVEIKVGDTIKGAAGATGIVTKVEVNSGTWLGGNAAGYLTIKTKTGTFVNAEVITKKGVIATGSGVEGGSGYAAGDILTVTQTGGSGAMIVITDVDGYGSVVSFVVVDGGHGYSAATGLPTVALTGTGNGDFTFTISTLATTTYALSATGTVNAGDALQKLMFVGALAAGQAITQVGDSFKWLPILPLGTA